MRVTTTMWSCLVVAALMAGTTRPVVAADGGTGTVGRVVTMDVRDLAAVRGGQSTGEVIIEWWTSVYDAAALAAEAAGTGAETLVLPLTGELTGLGIVIASWDITNYIWTHLTEPLANDIYTVLYNMAHPEAYQTSIEVSWDEGPYYTGAVFSMEIAEDYWAMFCGAIDCWCDDDNPCDIGLWCTDDGYCDDSDPNQ
jgi:hypothetical protein